MPNKLSRRFDEARYKRRFNHFPARVSSATLQLEDEQGRILVIKATYKKHWTFPGGIIDPGETPKQAAIRETLEEVGITIDVSTVEFVSIVNRESSISETYQFVFKAPLMAAAIDTIVLQASEIASYDLVTREDIERNPDGRIYGNVILGWKAGTTGYIEQDFDLNLS